MAIELRPVTSSLGVEVSGVDLTRPLSDEDVAALRAAWIEHQVLFFRGQAMTPEDQLGFCRSFGEVMPSTGVRPDDEVLGVSVLDQVRPVGQGSDQWHSDHMFWTEPPIGTVLRAVQLPPVGGDTCFVSTAAAYDALSEPVRDFLAGLSAFHSPVRTVSRVRDAGIYRNDFDAELPSAVHPVVRRHPESGRSCLYVSERDTLRIVELTDDESAGLLSFLRVHLRSVQWQCRFSWEPDSVAFWDNRSVQHIAVTDYDERRIMHRSMISAGQDRHQ